jgi:hypothetical protein
MSEYPLAILIPTVVGREEQLEKLLQRIHKQRLALEWPNHVQVQIKKDNKEMTVGEKRNLLYQESIGIYSFMPDDDDDIADDFLVRILKAIKHNPDCVTYYEHVDIDGNISHSNHSIHYDRWHDNPSWPEGFKYARTPYFKDVIKTEIAKSVEVPPLRWNEDEQWANALHPRLNTEVHIDDFMYFYKHVSSDPTERYGLNK